MRPESGCARPVSWLQLERFALGECSQAEQGRVRAHLEACPACRQALEAIESDARPLPPLSACAPCSHARPLLAFGLPALAAAAAALVYLALVPSAVVPGTACPQARKQVKGGELAISLVRERAGMTRQNPRRYMPGDRFTVRLTCPPGRARYEVLVFQQGQAFFPMPGSGELQCGNLRPLPGAFRLSGSGTVAVCAVLGEDLPDREALTAGGLDGLPEDAVCVELERGQ